MAMPTPLFVATQLSLLSIERASDLQQSTALITSLPPSVLARTHGLAILNLSISAQRTGLGGKTVLDLDRDSALGAFPAHSLRAGDPVRVEELPSGAARRKEKVELKEQGVTGVVVRVEEGRRIVVAVDKGKGGGGGDEESAVDVLLMKAGSGGRLWVVKVASDVTYVRMEKAMHTLLDLHEQNRLSRLHKVLLGQESPSQCPHPLVPEVQFFDENLNDSQRAAVRFAVAAPELALLHGPPGTGKTQTLIEVLQQLVRVQGKRVFVCDLSNISVDNIILRIPPDIPTIRVGY